MPRLFSCADGGAIVSIRGTPRSGTVRRCGAGAESICDRRAFTLVESLIAMTVIALAGAALLTSIAWAVSSCNDTLFQVVGRGFGVQLMDEIAAANFPAGYSAPVASTGFRYTFTKIDDYANFSESPPHTKSGAVLGNDQSSSATDPYAAMMSMAGMSSGRPTALQAAPEFVGRFARSVLVERVQPSATGSWSVVTQNSSYRRVTVTVTYTLPGSQARPVAKVMRVFGSITPSP